MIRIFPIVEGHGEVTALPLLIRRIIHEKFGEYNFDVISPYRLSRTSIGSFNDKLLNAVKFGGLKLTGEAGGVLIVADADDDCPLLMSSRFRQFCERHNFDFPVGFVLANKEYETWFISSGESMRAHQWVRGNASSHPRPEEVRGAKEFFRNRILIDGKSYSETVDQVKYTAMIELDLVTERCRSFRKLVKELGELIGQRED